MKGLLSDSGQRTDLFSHQNQGQQEEQERTAGGSAPLREETPEHRQVLIIGRWRDMVIDGEQGIEPGALRRRRPLDHPAPVARILRVLVSEIPTLIRHPGCWLEVSRTLCRR